MSFLQNRLKDRREIQVSNGLTPDERAVLVALMKAIVIALAAGPAQPRADETEGPGYNPDRVAATARSAAYRSLTTSGGGRPG